METLRRDFLPQLFALAQRIPNPRVARTTLVWSILAAYGASFFVSVVALVVLSIITRPFGPAGAWQGAAATILAMAAALAVAYVTAGRESVTVYAGIFLLEKALAIPGMLRFCQATLSDATFCSLPMYVLGFWPEALGALLAYRLVRWVRTGEGDRNRLLEPAGALAFTQATVGVLLSLFFIGASAFEAGIAVIASALAAGAACGLVLVRRIEPERQWRTLGVIATAVVVSFILVTVPGFIAIVGVGGAVQIGGVGLLGFAAPVLALATAALVLYMAAARKIAATATEPSP